MKRELEHFRIGSSYGGNQDWFPTYMMRIGGCGAQTACDSSVYFALHCGLKALAPANAASLTQQDYVRFAYEMEPYLAPRMSGIDRLEFFMDGYAAFLRDRGETRISMTPLPGEAPYAAARSAVIAQIDRGLPIPTLILRHRDRAFADYVWHWFLINGYDDADRGFFVKAVTYGEQQWLDLRTLWNTGHKKRGGFVLFRLENPGCPELPSCDDAWPGAAGDPT